MGVKIDQFDYPVCSCFEAKIVHDQLCYELDPNKFIDKTEDSRKLDLLLIIDYNEDRQFEFHNSKGVFPKMRKCYTCRVNIDSYS